MKEEFFLSNYAKNEDTIQIMMHRIYSRISQEFLDTFWTNSVQNFIKFNLYGVTNFWAKKVYHQLF
jgi:hypothetical protein